MSDVQRQEGQPFNRLTSAANTMLSLAPPASKTIVMLTDGKDNAIALSGWEDDSEAVVYMFIHLQAIMRSGGKELRIMTDDGIFIDGGSDV